MEKKSGKNRKKTTEGLHRGVAATPLGCIRVKNIVLSDHNFHLNMNNVLLQQLRTCKYLGVMFDDELSWKPHIDFILNPYTPKGGCSNPLCSFSPGTFSWIFFFTERLQIADPAYLRHISAHLSFGFSCT